MMLHKVRNSVTPLTTHRARFAFIGLLFLGSFFALLFAYGHQADGDVTQMFDKILTYFREGKITPYGPASASGSTGHVPGSLLSLSLVLPMKVWYSIWAPLTFLWLLHLLGFLFLCNVMKNYLEVTSFFFLTIMFWINPYRASEVFLWNPGYMFFAGCFHLWTLFWWQKNPCFFWSFLHVFALFVGLQIHPSVVILGGVSFTFLLIHWKNLAPWKVIPGLVLGALVGLATLIPFFIEFLANPHIMPQAGNEKGYLFFGLVHVFPVLKSAWYWILFGSSIFQTHIFHKTSFSWISDPLIKLIAEYFFLISKYLVGAVSVILSFYFNSRVFKRLREMKIKISNLSHLPFPLLYVLVVFSMNLLFNAISPTTPQYWHVLYVFPAAVISAALGLEMALKNRTFKNYSKIGLAFLCFYFSLFNMIASRESLKHNWGKNFQEIFDDYSKKQKTSPSPKPQDPVLLQK
jgi:hypothetical protein